MIKKNRADLRSTAFMILLLFGTVIQAQTLSQAEQRKNSVEDYTVVVMRAIFDAASTNQSRDLKNKVTGDQLTSYLVREAAKSALELSDKSKHTDAFLMAISLCLDDSNLLSKNPFLRKKIIRLEKDSNRPELITVVGSPKMSGRRDLAKHFFLSIGLYQALGPELARSAGFSKELGDAKHGSGFSFVDLQADHAGIAFASAVSSAELPLEEIAESFTVASALPDHEGLEEGLSYAQFAESYLNAEDLCNEAYLLIVQAIDRSIAALYE